MATVTAPVVALQDDADLSGFTVDAPAGPTFLRLAVDYACNLACPSCRSTPHRAIPGEHARVRAVQAAALSEGILEGLEWLSISGSGDPFASAANLELLRSLSPEKTPNLKVRLHTNGLLLDATAWEKLGPARRMVRAVEVSADAATPETYAVNRGGNWAVLIRNLEFISSLRSAGALEIFQLSFVVQSNNWREAPAFLAMGRRLGCDVVAFSAISNWGTFRPEDFVERAVHLPGHPDRPALRAQFSMPQFSSPPAALGGLLDPEP
jgi:MoaA/NifB/PqqE/SkfB family radical SAM enzyme